MVNRIWPTAVAGEADSVSSLSASACHIGGPSDVNPGELMLVYGSKYFREGEGLFLSLCFSVIAERKRKSLDLETNCNANLISLEGQIVYKCLFHL